MAYNIGSLVHCVRLIAALRGIMVIKGLPSANVDGPPEEDTKRDAAEGKKPRLAKRRKGEEAKGRPSHMGRDSEPESLLR